jgi:hypothetical protein
LATLRVRGEWAQDENCLVLTPDLHGVLGVHRLSIAAGVSVPSGRRVTRQPASSNDRTTGSPGAKKRRKLSSDDMKSELNQRVA